MIKLLYTHVNYNGLVGYAYINIQIYIFGQVFFLDYLYLFYNVYFAYFVTGTRPNLAISYSYIDSNIRTRCRMSHVLLIRILGYNSLFFVVLICCTICLWGAWWSNLLFTSLSKLLLSIIILKLSLLLNIS